MSHTLIVALSFFLIPLLLTAEAHHPLDSLEGSEITNTVAILKSAGHIDSKTLIASVSLHEPPKSEVLRWKAGDPIPRSTLSIFRKSSKTYETVVDLGAGKVTSIKEIAGAQPFVTMPEILAAIEVASSDPRMQEGIRKRGITEFDKLFCAPRTAGNFGEQVERTRRIAKVDCFDSRGTKTNVFANPIEGLFAIVDLDRREVIEVTDLGVVPVPGGKYELDAESNGPSRKANPVEISTPKGSNIEIKDSIVRWQKWSLHWRWDIRAGVVVSLVAFDEGKGPRSVLYQGSLAEIFVPYQDPTKGWYFRNYMDEGDYGFGSTSAPLVQGKDCPENAVYFPAVMVNAGGGVDTYDKRVCIFERPLGEPVWRHFDIITQALESRPATELIIRYIATVGNYDYILDWIFDQKGNITYRAGATGIDGVKGVKAQKLSDPTAADETRWGDLVSPGRAGINHDHFLSIRLDMDVDGTSNTFMRHALVPQQLGSDSVRRSIWRVQPEVPKTDSNAKLRLSYEQPAMWMVMNSHKTNAQGYPVGYMLHPAGNASPLIDAREPPLSRAMFANYHLWVTPYDAAEHYAAGDYPNQSEPGQGLPQWTSKGRNIEDKDIVLWYTIGFHHLPSSEDWPVYNLGWHSFTLQPFHFFDRNPAMDLP